jgi:prepilin-type processing-associated H-X9-DG protein
MPKVGEETSRRAMAALILSLLGVSLLAGLTALVFGIDSWHRARKSGRRTRAETHARAAVVLSVLIPLYLWMFHVAAQTRPLPPELVCGTHLSSLGKAMMLYANDYRDRLPTASKWCDLVIQETKIDPSTLQCPGVRRAPPRCLFPLELYLYSQWRHAQGLKGLGASDYAMNPLVNEHSTASPADMAVLFESRHGWNQAGGPELLTTDHHKDRGCNVLFIDGHVEFIKTQDLGKLRWKPTP